MSGGPGKQRAVAELNWGDAKNPVVRVGNRSVHHYWALLAPHFRSVWLAPQRRSDEGGVSWTWSEVGGGVPPAPAELSGVRQRMTGALAAWLEDPAAETADAAVAKAVEQVVSGLLKKDDAGLAAFVCRTDAGWRVHSWGAAVPAKPFFPDNLHRDVSGTLLVGDKDANALEVVLENPKGVVIARTQTDSAGAFAFTQVSEGSYRVRVLADRVDFPVHGLDIEVGRVSVTGLELRSTALNFAAEKQRVEAGEGKRRLTLKGGAGQEEAPPTPPAAAHPRRRRRRIGMILAGAAALIVAGWWYFPTESNAGGAPSEAAAEAPSEEKGASLAADASRPAPPLPGRATAGMARPVEVAPPRAGRPEAPAVLRHEAVAPGRDLAISSLAAEPSDQRGKHRLDDTDDGESVQVSRAAVGLAGEGATRALGVGSVAVTAAATPAAGTALTVDANRESRGSSAPAFTPTGRSEEGASAEPVAGPPRAREPRLGSRHTAGASGAQRAAGAPAAPQGEAARMAAQTRPVVAGGPDEAEMLRDRRLDTAALPVEPAAVESLAAARGRDGQPAFAAEEPTRNSAAKPASPRGGRALAGEPAVANRDRPDRPAAEGGQGMTSPQEEAGQRVRRDDAPGAGLVWVGQMRVSAWQRPWLGDRIVPTVPVLAGEDDALESLRERMLRERRGRLPVTMANRITWHGVTLVVAIEGTEPLLWRGLAARLDVEARVRDGSAEIGWRADARGQAAEYRLETAAGQLVARVRVTPQGFAAVEIVPGGRATGWIGLECAPGEAAGLTAAERQLRFGWATRDRGVFPDGWRTEADWREGRGSRLEFPLRSGAPAREVVFHDPVTDWAMSCAVELR
jgi:hypothetical protein